MLDKVLFVRVNSEERAAIARAADKAETTVSDLVRKSALVATDALLAEDA